MARVRDAFPILMVADLERSLGFYRDRLGFTVEYEFEGFVSLAVEGGKLGLASSGVVAEPAEQPSGERVASVADPDGYTVHLGAPA